MKAIRSLVIEENGKRYVEYELASAANPDDATEWLRFRVEIEGRGFPRIPECLAGALDRAQKQVAAERHRIEQTGPWHLDV